MYHNISRKFLESRLQPAILGDHGIDKNALEYFQYVFKAGRYLVLAQKGCDEIAHALIGIFGYPVLRRLLW